ncbi:MAG: TonB-dependent receptor plug domain-containing protein [Parcubacteria group bacterium]
MRRLLIAASCLAFPTFALAQTQVNEVIVTATRLPAFVEETPSVHVIGREEIENRQAVFAPDILDTVPGLSVFRNGAFGGPASVSIRGASTDKTLVLIDGVPVNDPSTPAGTYDFSGLDLADVDRIEILSGPQGSIWGSDAIGGVIAFSTRELNGLSGSFEAGSLNTTRATLAAGLANETRAFGVSASGFSTDGISAAANGTEPDGFTSWTAGVNGRVTPVQNLTLDGKLRYTEGDVNLDGYAPPLWTFGDTQDRASNLTWSGYGRAKAEALGLEHALLYSGYRTERENFGAYKARRNDWRWTAGKGAAADAFAFLVGAERDETRATVSTGDVANLGETSAFAVVRWRPIARASLTASVRYDDPDKYASDTTGRIAGSYEIGWGLTASASFGQGYKVPTISQSVCDFCWMPAVPLKPEKAEGYDASLAWRSPDGRLKADVTGYRLAVGDQIAYVGGTYVNISRTLTTGVETEASVQVTDQLSVRAEYAYADAVDRSTGARLVRVPEHAGSASLDWHGERLRGDLTVRAQGKQADVDPDTFMPTSRKGYVVADAAVSYAVQEGLELTARVENLADRRYQQVLGYGEPGRTVYVGFRIRP